MKKIIRICLVAAILNSGVAHAGYQQWRGFVASQETDWDGARIVFSLGGINASICPTGQFAIEKSWPLYNTMVAMLMTASSMNKQVTVTSDANNSCSNNRVRVIGIHMN